MAKIFTRQEFYELVWSKPMTHLAKEFALSDVALHKVCRKHGIPTPPLGWWAKKAAGKKVEQAALPASAGRFIDKVVIASADLGPQSETIARAREEARVLASESQGDLTTPSHPVVERTLAKLRKGKPSDVGMVITDAPGLTKCTIAPQSIERLAVILPSVVRAISLQGFQIIAGEKSAHFKSEGETIDFSISEVIGREVHVLTESERAKQEAWERKRERSARSNSWDTGLFDKPRFPEWDYQPSGQLSFELEQVYLYRGSAPRRTFRDGKVQRLENMASDIAVGLAVLAAAKTEERLRREAQQRAYEEERRLRELAARAKHIEDRRIAGLRAVLVEVDELDRARRLLALLKAEIVGERTKRVSNFLAWAESDVEIRGARLTAKGIEDRFVTDRLFGEDDDHGFSTSRW